MKRAVSLKKKTFPKLILQGFSVNHLQSETVNENDVQIRCSFNSAVVLMVLTITGVAVALFRFFSFPHSLHLRYFNFVTSL